MSPAIQRSAALLVTGLVVAVGVLLGVYLLWWRERGLAEVSVICAGSLKPLFEDLKPLAEEEGLSVLIEAYGSVDVVRHVTEFERAYDVVAVADWCLIYTYLLHNYTDWFIVFARNEMIIAYTNQSQCADEITPNNWIDILNRSGVKVAASHPDRDPCGYRAVLTLKLADLYYNRSAYYWIYEYKNQTGDLVIRPKSIELLALLEAGEIDYAFLYYSELAEKPSLQYIPLPPEINLGNDTYAAFYYLATVEVRDKIVHGAPIMYGLTIPRNAPHPDRAIKLLFLLLSHPEIFENNYMPRITPAYAYNLSAVPADLQAFCQDYTTELDSLAALIVG